MDVLCANCSHAQCDHVWGEAAKECEVCNCKEFVSLATFAQLREAWELVGKIAYDGNWWGRDVTPLIREALRIRGQKGE